MRTFIPANARLIPAQAQRVFTGVIFDAYQWQQEQYDGSFKTFEMLKRPDTVRVIAIKNEKIIVLEQEQPGAGFFYDFPSGRADVAGETELAAAKRELLEETGMAFSSWKLIQAVNPHSKIDWVVYTFLAEGFESEMPQHLDSGEKITVTWKTLAELKELIKNPEARYLSEDIFDKVDSLDDLRQLPVLG